MGFERRPYLLVLLFALGCTDGEQLLHRDSTETADGLEANETTGTTHEDATPPPGPPELERSARRTPEMCPHMFKPSLVPLDPPEITPINSAKSVHHIRHKIERVEVIELSTYRVLFSLDEPTLESLRKTPKDRHVDWRPDFRPATLPTWEVGLLFYIRGRELPYLGHFFDDGDVYFVDEDDPWDTAVFDDDMNMRGVYHIPTDWVLDDFLTKRLGEHDPFGKVAHEARRLENQRCGRTSKPLGEPFPDLPKAIIEPADP